MAGGVWILIPARYGSSRFPGKPLAPIAGLPMIEQVRRRALGAKCAARVVVATDHEEIAAVVRGHGGEVVLTPEAPSGTHRCAAALEILGGEPEIVVNVQGDQPLVEPEAIDLVAGCTVRSESGRSERTVQPRIPSPTLSIGTLVAPFEGDVADPHRVKAVLAADGRALWFSRQPVPNRGPWWVHIGIYGFTPASLRAAVAAPRGPACLSEDLEQLAWLEAGLQIHTAVVGRAPPGVDTPEQLASINKLLGL